MLSAQLRTAVFHTLTTATLFTLAIGAAVGGESLSVDWSTVDAGGGTASGGDFSLTGTIGQVDADSLQPAAGGNFELTSGFWVVEPAVVSELVFKNDFETPWLLQGR